MKMPTQDAEYFEEQSRAAGLKMPPPSTETVIKPRRFRPGSKEATDKPRLLRFRGETYREGDVIVLCEPSDPTAMQPTLLLVTYAEELGLTELLPLRFDVLRVLNPEKWEAVIETLGKLRNPG